MAVDIEVPVRVETWRWIRLHYGTKPLMISKNTPIFGALAGAYFTALSLRSQQARFNNVKLAEPTRKINASSTQMRKQAFVLIFLDDIALADALHLEAFGAMIDQLSYMHRLGYIEGFNSLKRNIHGAADLYCRKYYDEDDMVTADAIRKEGERWIKTSRVK